MTGEFDCRTAELSGVAPHRLESSAVAALVIAAAGAAGLTTGGAPAVHPGPAGAAVSVVSLDGHLVVHTVPARGVCLVDIAVRAPRRAARAFDVITRRLGGQSSDPAA